MKRIKMALLPGLILLLFVFFSMNDGNSQNLVLNPSFENFSACPLGPSEFSNATNWDDPFVNLLTDTCSTSDLYNSCNPFGSFGVDVPNNIMGSEPARTGSGYAGIILSEQFALFGCNTLFGTNWREYTHGQLSAPLVGGETYCVTYYASLADNVKFATDDFGVLFSNLPISVSCASMAGNGPLPFAPQLQWAGGAITGTNGWTEMQWPYVAVGGEQFITIGNFKDDGATSFSCVNGGAFNPYAYYYIDDVSVIQGACTVLADELEFFSGSNFGLKNELLWSLDQVQLEDLFLLEKSENGEAWKKLGEIKAGTDEGRMGDFQFWDTEPFERTFYRLAKKDARGDIRFLQTIEVNANDFAEPQISRIFPNPARESIDFLARGISGTISIQVIDLYGREAFSQPDCQLDQEMKGHLDLGQLSPGHYKVIFRGQNLSEVRNLEIQP